MNKKETRAQSRKTILYGGILAVVAVLFILLSYYMNVRNDREVETMLQENVAAQTKIENLQTDNITLKSENERLRTELDELRWQISDIQAGLDAKTSELEALHDDYSALLEQYNALLNNEETE